MAKRSLALFRPLGIVVCLLGVAGLASPAQAICDPSKPIEREPWDRYHERDDNRCEGVYGEQPVSGDIIGEIASFTRGAPRYELNATPLTLTWPKTVEGPVFVRAVALREDLLYQMDAEPPPGTASFAWPSDLLVHRKIEPDELGVRAWAFQPLLGRPRPVHLPLTVAQGEPLSDTERYVVVVVPGAALRKLEAGLDRVIAAGAAVAEGGEPTPVLKELTPYRDLGRGYYAANTAFRFALPVLADPGSYRLRLRAEREDGEPDTESFWFVHVAP